VRFTTQAFHWDRGRPARRERVARTAGLKFSPVKILAPSGARSGRDAREELEWLRCSLRQLKGLITAIVMVSLLAGTAMGQKKYQPILLELSSHFEKSIFF